MDDEDSDNIRYTTLSGSEIDEREIPNNDAIVHVQIESGDWSEEQSLTQTQEGKHSEAVQIVSRSREQPAKQDQGVKRVREDSGGSGESADNLEPDNNDNEDGFMKVIAKARRRITRNREDKLQPGSGADLDRILVSMTSQKNLPKQFGMAKLLRERGIKGVLRMQYKSAFRIVIEFDTRDNALRMIYCKKIKELEYRCQLANETNISYGIIKQVDLELDENELTSILESDVEILAIKRLKRHVSGQWVDSETIRVSFKGPTLPPYVFGYGCRFKVEAFTFPVTQCSGCWKFGHLRRSCPKVVCPKCGEKHENCEIPSNKYKCINCGGPHMALDKSCPYFIKEKEIRCIMSQENFTYRKALASYLLAKSKIRLETDDSKILSTVTETHSKEKTYKDALVGMLSRKEEEQSHKEKEDEVINSSVGDKTKKKKDNKKKRLDMQENIETDIQEAVTEKEEEETSMTRDKSLLMKLLQRIKDVCFGHGTLDAKINMVFQLVIEEIRNFAMSFIRKNDFFNSVLKFINYE